MSDAVGISYLECSELAEMLNAKHNETAATSIKCSHLTVDVRDEDFAGGNVRGAINLCSEEFEEDGVMQGLFDRGASCGLQCFSNSVAPLPSSPLLSSLSPSL